MNNEDENNGLEEKPRARIRHSHTDNPANNECNHKNKKFSNKTFQDKKFPQFTNFSTLYILASNMQHLANPINITYVSNLMTKIEKFLDILSCTIFPRFLGLRCAIPQNAKWL